MGRGSLRCRDGAGCRRSAIPYNYAPIVLGLFAWCGWVELVPAGEPPEPAPHLGARVLLDPLDDLDGLELAQATPMSRIVSRATSGVDPHLYGIGPVEAARTALRRAGLAWSDLAAVELNEAFAAQSLACLREWPELDPQIVNQQGGAIAIGHPLGCSGVRLVTTLAHLLRRTGGRYGLAAMCIGVGQGIDIVIENLT